MDRPSEDRQHKQNKEVNMSSSKEKLIEATTANSCGGNSEMKKTYNCVNISVCILLLISMGFSTYTFVYQMQYEDRMRQLHLLNERISTIEQIIHSNQFSSFLSTQSANTPSSQMLQTIAENATTATITADTAANEHNLSQIMQKMSAELSSIQRLRRDVTHLKAFRRGKRQAPNQPTSECMCPPGE